MNQAKSSYKCYLVCIFVAFGAIGTTAGATLPMVIRSFEWSYLAAGWLFAASAACYLAASWASGGWIPKLGLRRMLVVGLCLQGLGMGAFGRFSNLSWNLICFGILGLGQGMVEVSTNVGVVEVECDGQSRLMNMVHSGFTVGAILAPFVVGWIAATGMPWQQIYLALAFVACIMAIWTVFQPGLSPAQRAVARGEDDHLPTMKRKEKSLLILLCWTIFLYVGAEIGVSNWLAEYFVQHHQASTTFGANAVAVFWLGIFLGRLLLGLGWGKGDAHALLKGFSVVGSIFLMLALLASSAWVALCLFWVSGLGFSIVYPCVMSLAGHVFPHDQSRVVAWISASGGLGVWLFPLLMSMISQHWDIQAGFWFYTSLSFLMLVAVFAAGRLPIQVPEES